MWGWDPCGRPRGGVAGVSISVEEDGYEEARGRAKGGNGHPTPPPGRPQGSPPYSTPLPPLQRYGEARRSLGKGGGWVDVGLGPLRSPSGWHDRAWGRATYLCKGGGWVDAGLGPLRSPSGWGVAVALPVR